MCSQILHNDAVRSSGRSACDRSAAHSAVISLADTLQHSRQRWRRRRTHTRMNHSCPWRRDIAPELGSLEETNAALRAVVAQAEEPQCTHAGMKIT